MKKLLITLLIYTGSSYATVYENSQDKTTKRWKPYNNISKATIKNIYDKKKKSRVIFFKSQDSRNGYMLPMERDSKTWCKTKGKSLKWSMSTKDDFVILVSLQTTDGHRYIIYTPSDDKMGRGYYGLGKSSMDGNWHKFSRDLDLDLKRYEPDNEIIAVDTFFIRGKEIRVDDVEIVSIKESVKKHFTPKKPKECKIYVPHLNKKEKKKLDGGYDSVPPVIKLNGKSTVTIRLGDEYKEQGAMAIDNVDGRLNVDISGDIDSSRVGTYTLFYMVKDKTGNTSMTTRIVNVRGVSHHNARVRANRTHRQRSNHHKEDKHNIKSVKNRDLEFAMPPEDNALQEFGIVD
jgi:hypothetical protein